MNSQLSAKQDSFLFDLWLYSELWRRNTRLSAVLTGLLLGTAILCRTTDVLWLVPLVLELFVKRRLTAPT